MRELTISDQKANNGKETFTVNIGSTSIKNCKVVEGKNGPFISGPAIPPKTEGGKWFNVVYFSPEDSHEVLEILRGAKLPEIQIDDSDVPF